MAGKVKRISFTVINDLSYDQRMQRICTALTEKGYSVTLIGRKLPASAPLPSFPFHTTRLRLLFQKGKWFYLEYQCRLFFRLLFSRMDYYGAVDLDTLLPNTLVSMLKRKPLIYDAHEYFTEVPEVVSRPGIKAAWERVARFGIPRCRLAYTVSPGLAKVLSGRYGIPFGCVRNLPYRRDAVSIPTEKKIPHIILYQGALNEGRCLESLIEAVKGLPVQVWIAGEGDLSLVLREKASGSRDPEQICFLGYLSPTDLKRLTPQAWIGFNVLDNKGLSYYYSLANKCFDYLQAGVPCLCSPFPEYLNLAESYPALLFAEPDPNSIREAISVLLNDPERYTKLQAACLLAARELNWELEKEEKLYPLYAQLG